MRFTGGFTVGVSLGDIEQAVKKTRSYLEIGWGPVDMADKMVWKFHVVLI